MGIATTPPIRTKRDELMFRPLAMKQCWTRAYDLTFQKRRSASLYRKLVATLMIPVALCVLVFPPMQFTFDDADFPLIEVALLSSSILICNGPVMVATAAIYAGGLTEDNDGGGNDDKWSECIEVFFQRNHSPSSIDRRRLLCRTVVASLLAMVFTSLASVVLYLPGIYLAVRWYFVPCVVLFETINDADPTVVSVLRRSRGECNILLILVVLFLMEVVPMGLLVLLASLFHEMTQQHAILGHNFFANLVAFGIYGAGTVVHKCFFVPHSIVLKTVIYFNFRIIKGGEGGEGEPSTRKLKLDGDSLRSYLADHGLALSSNEPDEVDKKTTDREDDSDEDDQFEDAMSAFLPATEDEEYGVGRRRRVGDFAA